MQHYFVNPQSYFMDHCIIQGSDVHHLTNVMRHKENDFIVVLNNLGQAYKARIAEIKKDLVVCRFVCEVSLPTPRLNCTIAQAMIKKDRFEEAISRMTEVGVSGIIPMLTERCIIKLDQNDFLKKQERFQTIIKEASEQSERLFMPQLFPIQTLKDIAFADYDVILVAHAREPYLHYHQVLSQLDLSKKILLLIGPEGGFSEKELQFVTQKGAILLHFGHQILRSETAAISFLSVVRYLLEE